jgi:hypothetical protein
VIIATGHDVAQPLTMGAEQAIQRRDGHSPERSGPTSISTCCPTKIVWLLIVLPAADADA